MPTVHCRNALSKPWSLVPLVHIVLLLAGASPCTATRAHDQSQLPNKRDITVADIIRMTRLAMPDGYTSGSAETINQSGYVAKFSPDGRRFTILLRRGELRSNRNIYSLLLFETSRLQSKPELLLEMSSSSNRPAISALKWIQGGRALAFLGEEPRTPPQVYVLNIATGLLRQMTHHATPVVAYDIDEGGRTVVFEANPKVIWPTREIEKHGLLVTTQGLDELLARNQGPYVPSWTMAEELYVKTFHQPERRIPLSDLTVDSLPPLVSPHGKYALIRALVRKVPATWSGYQDEQLRKLVELGLSNLKIASPIQQFFLIDTSAGKCIPLLDAPSSYRNSGASWASDGKSVILTGTYLPLEHTEGKERMGRRTKTYVVQVMIPQRQFVEITDRPASFLRWAPGNRVVLEMHDSPTGTESTFEERGGSWKEVAGKTLSERQRQWPRVVLEEDLNHRPRIYALLSPGGPRMLLLDLNPEFDHLELGTARQIEWKAADGHLVNGALFLPPGYSPTVRYPLVIQTHGFVSKKFYTDGPWTSAYAARPLACKGIVVLQIGYATANDDTKYVNTTEEGPRAMAVLEGAIDYLDRTGVIDRTRVGILAFSRTVYDVAYTLTHSSYRFAAVTLADGFDGGYLQYLSYPQSPLGDAVYVNGGPPAGDSLRLWFRNSPEFNLDKVHSPVRLEAYGRLSLISGWERFSMLSHLGKPVEYVYIPDGVHILVKPCDRMISQQGNVDWFTFWLKGEVDPDQEKRSEYERWSALRQQLISSSQMLHRTVPRNGGHH